MGLRSRLEKQPTDFRQSTSYFGDRTLAAAVRPYADTTPLRLRLRRRVIFAAFCADPFDASCQGQLSVVSGEKRCGLLAESALLRDPTPPADRRQLFETFEIFCDVFFCERRTVNGEQIRTGARNDREGLAAISRWSRITIKILHGRGPR
jgi:hypothetical protein